MSLLSCAKAVRVTDTGALGLESTANACGPAKGGINEFRNLLGR